MRKLVALLIAGSLASAMSAPALAKPFNAWEDAADDAGNQDSSMPGAKEAGFDLTSGTIDKVGKDLVFTVTHSAMPASNQPGEAFRFLWHFDVGKKQYRFTVKSSDIGKPDVVAQSGTERVGKVYTGVARLEEGYLDTTLPISLSQFSVVEYYEATFDAAKKTITWNMPLKALKLAPGAKILPGSGGSTSTGCQICWIPHYAERSLTPHTIIDSAFQTKSYTVPK